jgi:hypothetical protein
MPVKELITINKAATSIVQYQTLPTSRPCGDRRAGPDSTAFLLDLRSAIQTVDRRHGAGAGNSKRHLDLLGFLVVVRSRRVNSQLLAQRLFERGLFGLWSSFLSTLIAVFAVRGSLTRSPGDSA